MRCPFVCTISPPAVTAASSPLRVDLNADVGESFGAYAIGHDRGLMKVITSASIAAGFHAGDPSVLRQTIRLAKEAGIAIGAHPGFPDLAGFGRRDMRMSAEDAEDLVLYQLAAVAGVASAEGMRLQHVKPHGALFNMAARDGVLASAIARAVSAFDRQLILFGPPDSELVRAGEAAGLRVAAEGFADRAYEPDGSLVSRTKPGAVITNVDEVVKRAVRIVREHTVVAANGATIPLKIETLCVHSDTEAADVVAARLRTGLEAAGIRVVAVSR
jgi:5-oxoprolinase (ATP-hydrolysing) subunit A